MSWFARIGKRLNSKADKPQGFLGRLRRDERGATLAMIAAVTIPLIAMVGGAVDMSRAYLVKVRLQQACDAGALAARRTMTGATLAGDTAADTQGKNFFNINLAQGAYGATNITFALKDATTGDGVVHGDATADVPTTLMRVFTKDAIKMTAECEAQLNVANNDIMFVLDVTGSMSCLPSDNDSTCDSYAATHVIQSGGKPATTEKDGARIQGLRQAVAAFFNTISDATSTGARLRVGFVPYSSGINIGATIKAKDATWLASSADYDSRRAYFNTPVYLANAPTTAPAVIETYSSTLSSANCTKYQTSRNYPTTPAENAGPFTGGGPAPTATTSTVYSAKDWGATGTTTGTNRTCRRNRTVTTTTYTTRYKFTSWQYLNQTLDPSSLATNGSITLKDPTTGSVPTAGTYYNAQQLVTLATGQGFTDLAADTWDGCIDERITGNADVDTAPTSVQNTKWRPSWPGMVYARTTGVASETGSDNTNPNYKASPNYIDGSGRAMPTYSCPKAAQNLAVLDKTTVADYVKASNGFLAHGQTYHDIGMLWGVRLMSNTGMWKDVVNLAPGNGKAVNRHIIFMTDGAMEPSTTAYSTYGIERLDKRVMPTGSDLTAAHNARFLALCQWAETNGITVWTVSFASGITSELKQCAKDDDHWFQADDTATLIKDFQSIAQKIAELRLSR